VMHNLIFSLLIEPPLPWFVGKDDRTYRIVLPCTSASEPCRWLVGKMRSNARVPVEISTAAVNATKHALPTTSTEILRRS
jgi:hypothetical protein